MIYLLLSFSWSKVIQTLFFVSFLIDQTIFSIDFKFLLIFLVFSVSYHGYSLLKPSGLITPFPQKSGSIASLSLPSSWVVAWYLIFFFVLFYWFVVYFEDCCRLLVYLREEETQKQSIRVSWNTDSRPFHWLSTFHDSSWSLPSFPSLSLEVWIPTGQNMEIFA